MSINRMSRIYQYMLDKLKTPLLAVPGYLAIRTAFRLRLSMAHGAPVEDDPDAAEAKVNGLFARPAFTPVHAEYLPGDGTDISVIVPAYNAEELIESSVLSILGQKINDRRMEVLVVDDGSKDKTGAILDRLASAHPALKVIHQKNGGAAAARNCGLDHARGRYIMFVDADDRLPDGAIEALMNAADREKADFVQGSWKYDVGSVQRFEKRVCENAALTDLIEIPGTPWGKVIRRELFREIRYPTEFNSYEDTIIKCLLLRMSKRVAVIPDVVYSYKRNPKGITFTSKANARTLQTYWIQEKMEAEADHLGLKDDAPGCAILLQQLTSITIDRVAELGEETSRAVFALCRRMAMRRVSPQMAAQLPYAQKQAFRAFEKGDFKAWMYLGKKWHYIL